MPSIDDEIGGVARVTATKVRPHTSRALESSRVDVVVEEIDLRSAFRVALAVSAVFFTALLLAGVGIWIIAGLTGLLGGFEELLADTTGISDYQFPIGAFFVFGLMSAAFSTLVTAAVITLLAAGYNVLRSRTGGLLVRGLVEAADGARADP